MKILKNHRENLRAWLNANGHSSSIDTTSLSDTLIVNGHRVWHDIKHGSEIEWFMDTPSDHPYNGYKGTTAWNFRIACVFDLDDENWEEQALAILKLISVQDDFWKIINVCMEEEKVE